MAKDTVSTESSNGSAPLLLSPYFAYGLAWNLKPNEEGEKLNGRFVQAAVLFDAKLDEERILSLRAGPQLSSIYYDNGTSGTRLGGQLGLKVKFTEHLHGGSDLLVQRVMSGTPYNTYELGALVSVNYQLPYVSVGLFGAALGGLDRSDGAPRIVGLQLSFNGFQITGVEQ